VQFVQPKKTVPSYPLKIIDENENQISNVSIIILGMQNGIISLEILITFG
jgi:hypothetical protein